MQHSPIAAPGGYCRRLYPKAQELHPAVSSGKGWKGMRLAGNSVTTPFTGKHLPGEDKSQRSCTRAERMNSWLSLSEMHWCRVKGTPGRDAQGFWEHSLLTSGHCLTEPLDLSKPCSAQQPPHPGPGSFFPPLADRTLPPLCFANIQDGFLVVTKEGPILDLQKGTSLFSAFTFFFGQVFSIHKGRQIH